jgi:hypothetical protein
VIWDLYPSPFIDEDGAPLPAGDEFRLLNELLHQREDDGDDPFEGLSRSPFDALHVEGRPEYDLDGNVVAPVAENPWADIGGDPARPSRDPAEP